MKTYFKSILTFICLLGGTGLVAQTAISGTVTAADTGEPLIGVNILVEGTSTGTITDLDGRFSLNVPSDESRLVSPT